MQTRMRNGIAAGGAGTSAAAVRSAADTITVAAAKAQAPMDRRKVESIRIGMVRVDRQLKVEVCPGSALSKRTRVGTQHAPARKVTAVERSDEDVTVAE